MSGESYTIILSIVVLSACIGGNWDSGTLRTCPDCNVILISIDTLRADHLGCYGYRRNTSPNIDRFASEAVVFSDSLSQAPWTYPSHYSMFTSLYLFQHNFSQDAPMIAEILYENGYTTAAFVDASYLQKEFGMHKGFMTYDDTQYGGNIINMYPKVSSWIEGHRDEKFFLFLHFFDVHAPYFNPEPYMSMYVDEDYVPFLDNVTYEALGMNQLKESLNESRYKLTPDDMEYLTALYDGGVTYTDFQLNRYFEKMKELGIYEDTLIIITSDHGESLGELEGEEFPGGLILDHNHLLDTNLKVPLIMRFPDGANAGVSDEPVQTIDIVPTILDFLDVETANTFSGLSLLPFISGESSFNGTRFRLAQNGYNHKYMGAMVRDPESVNGTLINFSDGRYRIMIYCLQHPAEDVRVNSSHVYKCDLGCTSLFENQNELYDLRADPNETENIILGDQETAEKLRKLIYNALVYDRIEGYSQSEVTMDEETLKQLRSLGYIN